MRAWMAVAAILFSGAAYADADGNELITMCKQTVKAADAGHLTDDVSRLNVGQCLGMMEGVKSTLSYLENSSDEAKLVCWPKGGITNGQAARIVVKYLENHPAELNKERTLLTILAFMDAYPCKK